MGTCQTCLFYMMVHVYLRKIGEIKIANFNLHFCLKSYKYMYMYLHVENQVCHPLIFKENVFSVTFLGASGYKNAEQCLCFQAKLKLVFFIQ